LQSNDLLSNCLDLLDVNIRSITADYEVIVTDDSKDNIAKALISEKYSWAKWVAGPKHGPAANRNSGAKVATGEWLIFLDDDCLPQQKWLASYIDAINSTGNGLVFEGRTDAERPQQRFDEEAPINIDGNKLWSCNFAINKALFNQLNGFDESFPFAAMEDVDFYTRVCSQSSITFLPDAFVIHPWRRMKPFTSLNKQLMSQKHFANKYGLLANSGFRWSRFKIFAGGIFIDFKKLLGFSMKGWAFYLEKCVLNFCLIFI